MPAQPRKRVGRAAPRAGTERADAETPQEARPRNTQADRDFIAANLDDFRQIDGSLIWSGRTQDIGSPYQLPPADRRCVRARVMHDDDGGQILDVDRNPLRDRCPKWAMLGADLCVDHAKGSRAVMDEVRKRIVGAADVLAGALIAVALDKNATDSDRIKAINSLLDRAGIRGGMEISPDVPAWRLALQEMMGEGAEEPDDSST